MEDSLHHNNDAVSGPKNALFDGIVILFQHRRRTGVHVDRNKGSNPSNKISTIFLLYGSSCVGRDWIEQLQVSLGDMYQFLQG